MHSNEFVLFMILDLKADVEMFDMGFVDSYKCVYVSIFFTKQKVSVHVH